MEVKLVVIGGKQTGKTIPVPGPKFLIGRGEDCQLRPQSELVSGQHCAIILAEGHVTVQDFQSSSGTFINGERIEGECPVKNGDRLKVGPLEFDVQVSVPVGGKKKPKVHNIQEAAARLVEGGGGKKDLDISHWLDEEEEEDRFYRPEETAHAPPSTIPPAAVPDDDSKEASSPVKLTGQPRRDNKPTTTGADTAAADAFRRLFDGQ